MTSNHTKLQEKIENKINKLKQAFKQKEKFSDEEVVKLSQELDELILKYYNSLISKDHSD